MIYLINTSTQNPSTKNRLHALEFPHQAIKLLKIQGLLSVGSFFFGLVVNFHDAMCCTELNTHSRTEVVISVSHTGSVSRRKFRKIGLLSLLVVTPIKSKPCCRKSLNQKLSTFF
jgi:hypothetical protein